MTAGAFFGVDNLEMHIHPACHRCEMAIALHLRFGISQADTAVTMVVVDRVSGVFRQFFIKIDRVGFQPHHSLVHPEVRHLSRRVPSGATGQFIALDQNNICPAFLRQMIECRASGDTATDNHNFCA